MIQRSRGAVIRRYGNHSIAMYYDQPGDFFYRTGEVCPADVARKAGFKVDDLLAEKEKMAKVKAFEKTLSSDAVASFDRSGVRVVAGEAKGKFRLVGADGVAITDDLAKGAAGVTYKAITGQDLDLSTVGAPADDEDEEKDDLV